MMTESGVHSSLYPNSHHQIIFSKFRLKILYPPSYICDAWHYKDANTDLIRRLIDMLETELS